MNWEIPPNSKLVENLGWTLVSSIWQIAFISLILFLILRLCKNFSANTRYLFSVSALCFALVVPIATFVRLTNDTAQSRFANKTYDDENGNLIKSQALQMENYLPSAENRLQTANLSNENNFFSFENLRENFRKKLVSALPMLVLLWIFGICIYTLRLVGGVWQLHKYKTRGVFAPKNEWQAKFSELCEKLKIAQTVKLLQSNLIETPIAVGWLKPIILIPASVFLQMNPRELEMILAHELVHIRRCDNLLNLAQSFAEILFFYHPCVWWISAVIRREREFVCDETVLKKLESQRFVYANALVNLEEIRLLTKINVLPLASAATGGKLMQRIQRILQKNAERQNSKQSLWSAVGLAFLLISAVLTSVFWAEMGVSVNAESKTADKKMAIGFVSIPPNFNENTDKSFDETARLLIDKLTAHRIPAVGFVNGLRVTEGGKLSKNRLDVVRVWRDAGLEIGIGTYKHVWFYDTPYDEYVNRVKMNEGIAKFILMEKNLPLHYFSYPYLNTGKTTTDKIQFENWLSQRGLRSVKYTFDNQEWMYSYAYDMARKDNDVNTMKEIRAEFVDYMTKMLAHYEAYSQEMFRRDIAQTLVLTPSRLVVDSFDEVFGMFEKSGYRFVSMDEAQKDEAYNTPENFAGVKAGISWFERWQMAQGKPLRDEPRVSRLVDKIWNDKKDNK